MMLITKQTLYRIGFFIKTRHFVVKNYKAMPLCLLVDVVNRIKLSYKQLSI